MKDPRPLWRFLILALSALSLQGIPLLYMLMEGDVSVVLYFLHLYALIPVMAVVIPCWAGLGGVHPLAAFFPIGLSLLLLPVYESPGMGVLCLGLSLVASVAGREWKERREQRQGGTQKGR